MSSDPADLGQGLGNDLGSQGGSSPDEAQRLKDENASLRQQNRAERADRLAVQHGLSPTQAELLKGVDLDKQEDYAKRLSEEAKGAAPPAEPKPDQDPGKAQEPAPEPKQTPPQGEGEPKPQGQAAPDPVSQMGEGAASGSPTGDLPASVQEEFTQRINKAESLEEMNAIQAEMRNAQKQAEGQTH